VAMQMFVVGLLLWSWCEWSTRHIWWV